MAELALGCDARSRCRAPRRRLSKFRHFPESAHADWSREVLNEYLPASSSPRWLTSTRASFRHLSHTSDNMPAELLDKIYIAYNAPYALGNITAPKQCVFPSRLLSWHSLLADPVPRSHVSRLTDGPSLRPFFPERGPP